jgi:hypothetical protein
VVPAASQPDPSTGRQAHQVRRIHEGEFVSAASAAVLLVVMFAIEWYGVDRPPGKIDGEERVTAENAWHALTIVRWLMLVTIVVAIGSLILHVSQRTHGVSTDTAGTVTVLGMVTAVVLSYRVLVDLPSPASVVDQKLGAFVGLLCAFGIALGGYHSLREARTGSGASSVAQSRRGRRRSADLEPEA